HPPAHPRRRLLEPQPRLPAHGRPVPGGPHQQRTPTRTTGPRRPTTRPLARDAQDQDLLSARPRENADPPQAPGRTQHARTLGHSGPGRARGPTPVRHTSHLPAGLPRRNREDRPERTPVAPGHYRRGLPV